MGAVRSLESFANLDVSTIFSNGLLDQTLLVDTAAPNTPPTVATIYTGFYLTVLFTFLPSGGAVFSPSRKAFITRNGAAPVANPPAYQLPPARRIMCPCLSGVCQPRRSRSSWRSLRT